MKYTHLFFDLDHTIWDFEANSYITLEQVYKQNDLEKTLHPHFNEFYQRYSFHNKKLWDRYHNGFIRQEDLKWKRMWHTLLDFKNGSDKLAKDLSVQYLDILPLQTKLFDYTNQIIAYLQQKGYQLHLITNGFEEVQRHKLTHSGLLPHFNQIITSERAMSLKPKKAIFDFALQQAGATTHNSIMLGDNLDADIQGAMNAGWDTVFVNHINEKTSLNPTYTITHLKQLEDIF